MTTFTTKQLREFLDAHNVPYTAVGSVRFYNTEKAVKFLSRIKTKKGAVRPVNVFFTQLLEHSHTGISLHQDDWGNYAYFTIQDATA
jgi:hypothetical protein